MVTEEGPVSPWYPDRAAVGYQSQEGAARIWNRMKLKKLKLFFSPQDFERLLIN